MKHNSVTTKYIKNGDKQCLKKIRRETGKLTAEIPNLYDGGEYAKDDDADT